MLYPSEAGVLDRGPGLRDSVCLLMQDTWWGMQEAERARSGPQTLRPPVLRTGLENSPASCLTAAGGWRQHARVPHRPFASPLGTAGVAGLGSLHPLYNVLCDAHRNVR